MVQGDHSACAPDLGGSDLSTHLRAEGAAAAAAEVDAEGFQSESPLASSLVTSASASPGTSFLEIIKYN